MAIPFSVIEVAFLFFPSDAAEQLAWLKHQAANNTREQWAHQGHDCMVGDTTFTLRLLNDRAWYCPSRKGLPPAGEGRQSATLAAIVSDVEMQPSHDTPEEDCRGAASRRMAFLQSGNARFRQLLDSDTLPEHAKRASDWIGPVEILVTPP